MRLPKQKTVDGHTYLLMRTPVSKGLGGRPSGGDLHYSKRPKQIVYRSFEIVYDLTLSVRTLSPYEINIRVGGYTRLFLSLKSAKAAIDALQNIMRERLSMVTARIEDTTLYKRAQARGKDITKRDPEDLEDALLINRVTTPREYKETVLPVVFRLVSARGGDLDPLAPYFRKYYKLITLK